MAESNMTKRALANALKALMAEKSFSKISIADICGRCGMNRKSFYYHFRDKCDLVNWIFDTEFVAVMQKSGSESSWKQLRALCVYFYENRAFYRRALKVEGQNSFLEHFRALLSELIRAKLYEMFELEQAGEFQVNFFADATAMTFQRWLVNPDCMPPDEFLAQLRLCLQCIANQYHELDAISQETQEKIHS